MAAIFLIGYMGSGKSTVGKRLAKKLNFNFIDLDSFIEEENKLTISEIFTKLGENEFRALEHNALKKLISNTHTVISCGGGTPCYYNNIELMNNNGITIYIKMSIDTLAQRLFNAKQKRPLVANLSTITELKKIINEQLEKREAFYQQAQYTVKGKNLNLNELALFIENK